MDLRPFFVAFGTVFLAELGDKTQLATLTLASTSSSRWLVFFGSALALVATSAIAVLAGDVIVRYVPPHWLKRAAGVMFLVLGALYLWTSRATEGS
jgi:putative Ca2+/H+ antiporter (TMEM165/GDT1 family)